MNASEEKPFVSFCVKCYNQREYISAALEGAFSQTYENMEIIISDDGSTDGSVEVIRREIEKYNLHGGRHPVVLNVNEKNLGNLGNWVKLCELAKGELLIKADGDDISLPERTAKIVEAWVAAGKKHDIVSHGYVQTDVDGNVIGGRDVLSGGGGVSAYTQKPLRLFSEPRESFDDQVWGDRVNLLVKAGLSVGTLALPERLILYRCGSGVSSCHQSYADWLDSVVYRENFHLQQLRDIDFIAKSLPDGVAREERERVVNEQKFNHALHRLIVSPSFKERWEMFRIAHKRCDFRSKAYWLHMMMILPPQFRNPMLNLAWRANRAFRRFKYRKIKPFEMLEAK